MSVRDMFEKGDGRAVCECCEERKPWAVLRMDSEGIVICVPCWTSLWPDDGPRLDTHRRDT